MRTATISTYTTRAAAAPDAGLHTDDIVSMPDRARAWARIARDYARPQPIRSALQLMNTVIPLAGLWTAMMLIVDHAWWATLLLSVPAAALTVRLFIIQHDCGHRSFFRSKRLNDILGTLIGVVTLTPHNYWRWSHNMHHTTCGNLQQRGIGDITLLTVAEYTALPWRRRLAYRIYRNPVVLLLIGPVYLFVIKYRLPLELIRRDPKMLLGVMGTNLGIAGAFVGLGLIFGFLDLLLVQAPIVLLSCAAGVWLFYVQHQFERTHWRDESSWDFHEASVLASSFYDLPQPLRWFSGNIGMHHIHHLSCRIPNYRLRACMAEIPALKSINRIRLRDSLGCLRKALWDEEAQRLVSFKTLRRGRSAA
ncbi:MAG: fatty acid desaturase [Alphaproteobacteria bacterium]|nr:fatty acid desaturase [Alphaproteobacteria bacterium]